MNAVDNQTATQKAAQEEAARRALVVEHVDTAPTPLSLTPEQQANADAAVEAKKAADLKNAAIAKADQDLRNEVAVAAAKHNKALADFGYDNIAEGAWEATRDPTVDPVWGSVQMEYRGKLQTHADSVEQTGLPESPSKFELKVADLLGERAVKQARTENRPLTPKETAYVAAAEKRAADVKALSHHSLTSTEVAAGKNLSDPFPQTAAEAEEAKRRADANAAAKAIADAKAKADAKK